MRSACIEKLQVVGMDRSVVQRNACPGPVQAGSNAPPGLRFFILSPATYGHAAIGTPLPRVGEAFELESKKMLLQPESLEGAKSPKAPPAPLPHWHCRSLYPKLLYVPSTISLLMTFRQASLPYHPCYSLGSLWPPNHVHLPQKAHLLTTQVDPSPYIATPVRRFITL